MFVEVCFCSSYRLWKQSWKHVVQKAPKSKPSRSLERLCETFWFHHIYLDLNRRKIMIFLDIQKPHQVLFPTDQAARQSEVPTRRYGQITEHCACWKRSGQQAVPEQIGHNSFVRTPFWRMTTRWKGNFIKNSIELYFVICYVEYRGENPRKIGGNNGMTTRRRRLRQR